MNGEFDFSTRISGIDEQSDVLLDGAHGGIAQMVELGGVESGNRRGGAGNRGGRCAVGAALLGVAGNSDMMSTVKLVDAGPSVEARTRLHVVMRLQRSPGGERGGHQRCAEIFLVGPLVEDVAVHDRGRRDAGEEMGRVSLRNSTICMVGMRLGTGWSQMGIR